MAEIIDGKAVAAEIKQKIKERAERFLALRGRRVGLAVVKVGEDPASAVYVRNKIKACEQCGIASSAFYFDADI